MKLRATIENIALAGIVLTAVALAGASLVAIRATENLIDGNVQILDAHRVTSSLEAIRFQAAVVDTSMQSYVITGTDKELAPLQKGIVELQTELLNLRAKSATFPVLAKQFSELEIAVSGLIKQESRTVKTRRESGFEAAKLEVARHKDDVFQVRVQQNIQTTLEAMQREFDALQIAQEKIGTNVRKTLLALATSAILLLIFLYGTLKRLSEGQRETQARLAHQASHDALTGLYNRAAVLAKIEDLVHPVGASAPVTDSTFAVLLLDLDGFKNVNDTAGHDVGDKLLCAVSKRLLETLRYHDFIARLGGDEFLVVIDGASLTTQVTQFTQNTKNALRTRSVPNTKIIEDLALRVGKKLVAALAVDYALPISTGAYTARITTSVGVSIFPAHGVDPEELLKRADLALYEAKRAGRNCVKMYEEGFKGSSRI
jgi:diguanylate cyclase